MSTLEMVEARIALSEAKARYCRMLDTDVLPPAQR